MPCLNSDVLFEIGKKLVENGDSEAVYRFGLSGKESWKALINIVSSATFLEIDYNRYSIGWDENRCCKFIFDSYVPHFKFLMNCVGPSVMNLKAIKYLPIYQKMLDNINEKRQLKSFYAHQYFSRLLAFDLLKTHFRTLKHVTVPSDFKFEELQNVLDLETLTCLDFNGKADFLRNSCKTTSLTLHFNERNEVLDAFIKNENLSSIKKISLFYNRWGLFSPKPKDIFPSLEYLCSKWNTTGELAEYIKTSIQEITDVLKTHDYKLVDSFSEYYLFHRPADSKFNEAPFDYDIHLFK